MKLIDLSTTIDVRGSLTSIAGGIDIPFDIKRCYMVHNIEAVRGGHAHRENQQIVIAAAGSIRMDLNDGQNAKSFLLESPATGLIVDLMTWIEIPEFTSDAVIVVLASTHYDHKKTIRDMKQFMELKNQNQFL